MKTFDLTAVPSGLAASPAPGARAALLLDQGQAKVRRIELDAGGVVPPCQMSDDVVFVMLRGSVLVTSGSEEELVAAPGAVYIPGGATTRSLRALEPSLVLAVLCKGAREDPPAANA
jgi:quercetin dioxygenase-like cupin family protein